MDEDGIALVLARASELRTKITNCIHNSSSIDATKPDGRTEDKQQEDGEEDEDEAESLLNILDSLEALEAQLSSLQALQQQQCYEKEASLADIDYSRKKLLQKLKDYKGEDLEVIHEATAFASSTVEIENNDLLLPPYPTRPPFSSTPKISQSGFAPASPTGEPKGGVGAHQSVPVSLINGLRRTIGAAAKTVFTLVGFIAVLHLSGFETRSRIKVLGMSREPGSGEKVEMVVGCPPGKVLVVENGETRCLVKERVEIPFEPVVTVPDVKYGCG